MRGPRITHLASRLSALWIALAVSSTAGAAEATDWINALAPRGGGWQAAGGGECRFADGVLEVRGAAGGGWTRVELARPPAAGYVLQVDLEWTPLPGRPPGEGFEIAVGPHSFGSAGYRIVAQREPWRVAECHGPKLAPGIRHAIEIQMGERMVAYRVADGLVAQSPVEGVHAEEATLRVAPGTQVVLRRCRIRPAGEGEARRESVREWERESVGARTSESESLPGSHAPTLRRSHASTFFAYGGIEFGHRGGAVLDPAAAGGRAVEVSGAPAGRMLLWGQDASLPAAGSYVALFGLRGMEGAGPVRLEVAPSGGAAVSTRTVRVEELPRDAYEPVAVSFRYEGSGPMEYRIRAERGRLRVDRVVVAEAEAEGGSQGADVAGSRPRRALPMAQAWGKAPQGASAADTGFTVVRLSRRWQESGWFEFTARWRVGTREPKYPRKSAAIPSDTLVSDVAVDVWVACRDSGGGVTTFDHGETYGRVEPGEHQVTAWLDPASCRQVGWPVALFVQVYRNGVPVAAAWRKWGIPVDDKYIVEARRVGSLRATSVSGGTLETPNAKSQPTNKLQDRKGQ